MTSQSDPRFKPGCRVQIVTPDNPHVHMQQAVVYLVADWGAYLTVPAITSGQFRAFWSEMVPLDADPVKARTAGYTGDLCDICGSVRVVRNGSCLLCEECGTTSGCS